MFAYDGTTRFSRGILDHPQRRSKEARLQIRHLLSRANVPGGKLASFVVTVLPQCRPTPQVILFTIIAPPYRVGYLSNPLIPLICR
jgi:hypothetical protein